MPLFRASGSILGSSERRHWVACGDGSRRHHDHFRRPIYSPGEALTYLGQANLLGVPVSVILFVAVAVVVALVITGLLAGLAGVLMTGRLDSAVTIQGPGAVIIIAAVLTTVASLRSSGVKTRT